MARESGMRGKQPQFFGSSPERTGHEHQYRVSLQPPWHARPWVNTQLMPHWCPPPPICATRAEFARARRCLILEGESASSVSCAMPSRCRCERSSRSSTFPLKHTAGRLLDFRNSWVVPPRRKEYPRKGVTRLRKVNNS